MPVLLTYDSAVMGAADRITQEFLEALKSEVESIYDAFKDKLPALNLRVHLCLFPLGSKETLSTKFHEVLTACQTLN